MKNQCWLVLLFGIMIVAGCNDKKKTLPEMNTEEAAETPDTTIYGICGEGTAMHTLQLITDKGDTVVYAMGTDDVDADVKGGLFCGDRLAVIADIDADGQPVARKVINLTSLIGKWSSLDKCLEICEGGVVKSDVKEPRCYTEWKILNGQLLLSADTFDVYSLGPDSLLLENADGIYAYKRLLTSKDN